MKGMFKVAAVISTMGLIGTGIYLYQDKNLRKKTGKKIIDAMDSAENVIAKKIN